MKKIVVFTSNNARILYLEEPEEGKLKFDYIVEPNLDKVQGIPPHFWKRDGNDVVPMSPEEEAARTSHHEEHGVHNDVFHPELAIEEAIVAAPAELPKKSSIFDWFLSKNADKYAYIAAGAGLLKLVQHFWK